jgi:riboflavin biosynthesis pyrimidine reductase
MNELIPLEALFEAEAGDVLPLPPDLATFYGHLRLPVYPDQSYVIGNFVTTLDGVVALNEPGHASGGDISGWSRHDRLVMGLLRAVADAVIVGAGTLRSVPRHHWTAQHIYPPQADAYRQLRANLDKAGPPLNVIVTARGEVDLDLPVFQSGEVPVLLVTTTHGAQRIRTHHLPPSVQISALQNSDSLSARAILQTVNRVRQCSVILVEGGPQLMGDFFAEHALDELFLTLAPQIAGRDEQVERPGLVMGQRFAPVHPLWGRLISVKRSTNHLFLRYAFNTKNSR